MTDQPDAEYEGYIEDLTAQRVCGWVWQVNSDRELMLEVLIDGKLMGYVSANRFRKDLLDSGRGQGRHAFEYTYSAPVLDYTRPGIIGVRVRGTERQLARIADLDRRLAIEAAADRPAMRPAPAPAAPSVVSMSAAPQRFTHRPEAGEPAIAPPTPAPPPAPREARARAIILIDAPAPDADPADTAWLARLADGIGLHPVVVPVGGVTPPCLPADLPGLAEAAVRLAHGAGLVLAASASFRVQLAAALIRRAQSCPLIAACPPAGPGQPPALDPAALEPHLRAAREAGAGFDEAGFAAAAAGLLAEADAHILPGTADRPHTDLLLRLLRRAAGLRLPAPPGQRLQRATSPRDLVILAADNDDGAAGRRWEMLATRLLETGRVRHVLQIDAPISAAQLETLADRQDHDPRRGGMIYATAVRRVLELADGGGVARRTFLHRGAKPSERIMGRDLPAAADYAAVLRGWLASCEIAPGPLLWTGGGAGYEVARAAIAPGLVVADLDDSAFARRDPAEQEAMLARWLPLVAEADIVFCLTEPVRDRLSLLRADIELMPGGDKLDPSQLWRAIEQVA